MSNSLTIKKTSQPGPSVAQNLAPGYDPHKDFRRTPGRLKRSVVAVKVALMYWHHY